MILPPYAITAFVLAVDLAIPHDLSHRALILVFALLLDAWLGEPDWLWRHVTHPVVIFGRAISFFDKNLNHRKVGGAARRRRGVLAIILLVLGGLISGGFIMALAGFASSGFGGAMLTTLVELSLVAILLAGRSLDDHVRAVATALQSGSIKDARFAISMIVGRNPETLDKHAIARAGIETTAENLSDGVIAPALFYLTLGLPGIIVYKMINTADSMTGYKSKRYLAYGWGAARLDDLVNLIPARLTGLLLVITKPDRAGKALTVMLRDAKLHNSPNAGWPEAAMAAQLNLSLAGPRRYGQRMSTDAPMHGEGRREATAHDIEASLTLMWRAIAVFAAMLIGVVLWG